MQLAAKADLYLITECAETDKVTEQHANELLQRAGLFQKGFMNPAKHLTCSTALGKAHIARQLDSRLHVDVDAPVLTHLKPHIPIFS